MLRRLQNWFARRQKLRATRLETELLGRLEARGLLILDNRLGKTMHASVAEVLRAACRLAYQERVHLLSRSGNGVALLTNPEYGRLVKEIAAETVADPADVPPELHRADAVETPDEAPVPIREEPEQIAILAEDIESTLVDKVTLEGIVLDEATLNKLFLDGRKTAAAPANPAASPTETAEKPDAVTPGAKIS